ncbi:MAG TPA: heavy metal-binding domain-containing protein [Elusimicrobiota bacterium]|nr:heavy metal-binding domain-containing protein [Elusimicrobiota bacterium]
MKRALFVVGVVSLSAGLLFAGDMKMPSVGKVSAEPPAAAPAAEKFTCSMCGGEYTGAGKCAKCGMDLVKKTEEKQVYSCPQCGKESDAPGKCMKCGVEMKVKEIKAKAEEISTQVQEAKPALEKAKEKVKSKKKK